MKHDIEKLPVWAQQKIHALERDLKYWQDKASAGPEGSRAFLSPYSSAPQPLGPDPTVEFRMGEDPAERYPMIQVRYQNEPQGRSLYIMGYEGIAVHPHAGNVIVVTAERRW